MHTLLVRSARRLVSRWHRSMFRWARLGPRLIHPGRRRPIPPLSFQPLESRDPPSDTLGALLGHLGSFGLTSWLGTFNRLAAEDGLFAGQTTASSGSMSPSQLALGTTRDNA